MTTFNMDFNFRPNALPTKPTLIPSPRAAPLSLVSVPVFSGLTSGFVSVAQNTPSIGAL